MTDLVIRTILSNFNMVAMRNAVGFDQSTITDFNRYQNATISRLPAANQPDENQRVIKLLECISRECPDRALALEATRELQAQGTARRFVQFANGAPQYHLRCLQSVVSYFDQLWRTLVQSGVISRAPAQTRGPVDDALSVDMRNGPSDHGGAGDVGGAALSMTDNRATAPAPRGFGTSANTPHSMEIVCDNCHGFGHKRDVCPSAEKPRKLETSIEVLTKILAARGHGANSLPQSEREHDIEGPRVRPVSPNGVRQRPAAARPRPFGSTVTTEARRVAFVNGKPTYVTYEAEDKPNETFLNELFLFDDDL